MRLTLIVALLASFAAILDARTLAVTQNDVTDADDESNVTSTSAHMSMSFKMGETPVRLELEKNNNIPPLSSYYTAEHGKLVQWTLDEDEELNAYVNRTTQDEIIMTRHRQNGSLVTGYMGSFNAGGRRYSLMTMDALKASRQPRDDGMPLPLPVTSNTMTVYMGDLLHAIEPVSDDELAIVDDSVSAAVNETDADNSETASRQRRAAAAAAGKRHYVIDYFVIADYAIYNRWYRSSTGVSDSERRQDAMRNIYYYYGHVVNGIDLRYSSIQHPDFAINVRFVGIMIAVTPSDSVWTERSDLKITWSGESYTDAHKAHDVLGEYIEQEPHKEMLATVDHVALFSGNTLYKGAFRTDGSGPVVISGLSWIGGACNGKFRTSVNKEFGQYGSINTGAHELGHNVGAHHDGRGNECSGEDQFIMAQAPQTLSSSNFDNAFRFSSCSIRSFQQYISTLNNQDRNCLSTASNMPTIPVDESRSPGQQYSADEQCQQLYGPSSFYCAGGSRDARICERMECWIDELQQCFASAEQRAFERTTCGNSKWCVRGRCVQDPAAPATRDACVYGDYRGLFDVAGRKLSCSQIGSEAPYKCYEANTEADCCVTCPRLRRTDASGCAYGDRHPDECRRGRRANCYYSDYKSRCCSTCGQPGPQGCEFGDRASWCSDIRASSCYSNEHTCCETCYRLRKSQRGCEYGDRADWCTSYVRGESECRRQDIAAQCCQTCARYTGGTVRTTPTPPARCSDKASWCSTISGAQCYDGRDTCCAACERFKTSPPIERCEFGDKATWCRMYVQGPAECQRSDVAQLCCHSCARYLNTQPTTTTRRPSCQDSADWCRQLYAGQCYDKTVEQVCCATCSRHLTSQPGCRYGNKYKWCRREYCWTNANDCCAVC